MHMTMNYHDWDENEQQDTLHFFYDAQSRPAKVSFNGVIYTYILNLQGDIVGLLDSTGNLVVEYKYDAWGKLLSPDCTLANTLGKRNPFRYRGYLALDRTSQLYEFGRLIMKVIVINGSLSANEQELYAKRVSRMYPGIEIDELLLDAGGEIIQYQAVVYKRVLAKQGGAVIGDPMMWSDAKRAEYEETVPNLFDIL